MNTTALVNNSQLSDQAPIGSTGKSYVPDAAEYEKSGITATQKQKVTKALQEEEYTFEEAEKMVTAALLG